MSSPEKSKIIKDDTELKCVKTSSSITNAVVKKVLLPKIETIIDDGSSVPHQKISDEVYQFYLDPKKMSARLDPSVVGAAFKPVIQSGGVYDVDSLTLSPGNLHFGCIIIQVGSKYKTFCSSTARTYLIDPPDIVRKQYSFLVDLHTKLIDLLYPGTGMNHIYNTAIELINEKFPKLAEHFVKDCGSSIGVELKDDEYTFNKDCTKKLQSGMVVTLRVGFENMQLPEGLNKGDKGNDVYTLLLNDTIAISDNGPDVLTDIKKKSSEICYSIEEGEEEDEEENEEESDDKKQSNSSEKSYNEDRVFRVTRSRLETNDDALKNSIARRKEHQKELAIKQQQEAQKRFFKNVASQQDEKPGSLKEYVTYKNPSEFPRDCSRNKIHVDRDREAVLLPLYGYLVPFHITTVKSVSKSEDYLRIIFKCPITATLNDVFSSPTSIFIKEVTYRVSSNSLLNDNYRLINELKKRVNDRESKKSVMETLTVQESLIKSNRPGPKMSNLKIRPTLGGGRKTLGTLEAHQNGFRFITTKKGVVDIIYRNIKHAFFQPSERVEMVLIHFHLHNAIMIGKKKTVDVQFYTEVVEPSHNFGSSHPSWGDADEIEEEQRRRMMKNRLNQQFKAFVKQVEEFSQVLEFDIPYKELGFYGAPSSRGNVFLQPTVHCLVHLTESFFVVTLDEVEVVYFERVKFGLKHFDMVIIFKDWSRPTVHINIIPIDSLDTIKEWLDSCDITYYEGPVNIDWKNYMRQHKANPKKFWESGGWAYALGEGSDDEEDLVEEEEEDFVPSGSDSDDHEVSDSESKSDNDSSFDEEDDDISMEESEEEGIDWDEHEELAKDEEIKKKRKREEEDKGTKKRKH